MDDTVASDLDRKAASAKDAMFQARDNGWELSGEKSLKMLPWTVLGVELHPALVWHLHRQVQ